MNGFHRPNLPLNIVLIALLAAVSLTAPAWSQNNPKKNIDKPRPMSDRRWQERAYGLSLQLPQDTRVVSQTADQAIARITDDQEQFKMSLFVKRSKSLLSVKKVAAEAKVQILGQVSINRILEEKFRTIADQPAAVLYAHTKSSDGKDLLVGQAIIELDPKTYAILEITSLLRDYPVAHGTFEVVLDSMQRLNPRQIAEQREAAIELGAEWRASVSIKDLHDALIGEQYFRILEGKNDLGYMRVRQRTATKDGTRGVSVEVQSRITAGQFYYDSLATSFLADDDSIEMWKVTTTRKPAAPRSSASSNKDENTQTFVETGVRAGDQITVTTDGPRGSDKRKYGRPKIGYLAQVEAWLLPQLLPVDRPGTYGFYFYSSNHNTVGFRTDQVTPTLSGYTIMTRLTPNDPQRKAVYKSNRTLVEKELGEGRRLVPASAAMIKQLWQNR